MKTTGALVKLVAFAVVTVLATALLATTISNASFTAAKEYSAVFSDVTGVLEGDDVRIAGVRVGEVQDVEVHDKTKAKVTFTVAEQRRLPESTQVAIRWRNLIGQRYLALSEGAGSNATLAEGGTIPISQTAPALDLDLLFNGFKPLFQALDGKQVNKLAGEIVQTLQGEAGSINSLLSHTASLTNHLADRDKLIGDLIDNLNAVLTNLHKHNNQLNGLLIQLQRFISGLSGDRNAILGSLSSINTLTAKTGGLVKDIRPSVREDVKQLGKVSKTLDANQKTLDKTLEELPIRADRLGRTGSYGSWFNFFLCDFDGKVVLPGGKSMTPTFHSDEARCAE
ncbi:MAG: MCE family protein [Streptosporangiales bacterium]|nr:MCE family protein [Streptosporangiales bacterium]